jgi:hypothetical protein
MYERLAEAAGNEYWKTVFDQLLTLPYGEDNKNVADALHLHSFSMEVLLLLRDAGLQRNDGREQHARIALDSRFVCLWRQGGKHIIVVIN